MHVILLTGYWITKFVVSYMSQSGNILPLLDFYTTGLDEEVSCGYI
jgi:hypothetical protein